uniref:Secreted protein n=1 Tax=Strongyloides stercoralis TaxID=6248 RepID=A0A0K0DZC9_STRER
MATLLNLLSLFFLLVTLQLTGAQYYGGMYHPYGAYRPYGGYGPYGGYRPYGPYGGYRPMMSPAGRAVVGLGLLASSVGKK